MSRFIILFYHIRNYCHEKDGGEVGVRGNDCVEKSEYDRIYYGNLRVVAVKGKVGYVGRESSSSMVRRSSYEARVVDVSKCSNC